MSSNGTATLQPHGISRWKPDPLILAWGLLFPFGVLRWSLVHKMNVRPSTTLRFETSRRGSKPGTLTISA
jgi:hypothetical protein